MTRQTAPKYLFGLLVGAAAFVVGSKPGKKLPNVGDDHVRLLERREMTA